ncbi:YqzK family protein [Alteribacter aurantiacus]|uniref:YqzK family protein n=1 Tax=Alteribacter aurantiacus TaxID=254410 RepID=UPI000429FA8C|nr:YqzK family protein [Alteribacter aurantiacus]
MAFLRSLYETMLVFVLFMGCTLVFYYGIMWVSDEYDRYHRYDEPSGRAVKVIGQVQEESVYQEALERLRLFYLNGE